MRKQVKILIVGPISDFGGREIEVYFIASTLAELYSVQLLSSTKMSNNSSAIIRRKNFTWNSIERKLYSKNILIKFLSWLTKFVNKRDEAAINFMGNKISHRLYNFRHLYLQTIQKAILKNDLVIFCGEFKSGWFKEIVEYSSLNSIPLIFRTTGTILSTSPNLSNFFNGQNCVLIHSSSNMQALNKNDDFNSIIIDQTSVIEHKLLAINLNCVSNKLTFGFLGRFGEEKGILELLSVMGNLENTLIIAGDGPLLNKVNNHCDKNQNLNYIGKLSKEEVADFFEKIDVLIISSYEEAGPLVGIESMAAGKLVISTKVGATEDRLANTDNQFWFDINDPKSLVNTIHHLESLPNEELIRIKNQVRERYIANYSNAEIASQYIRVVKELLS